MIKGIIFDKDGTLFDFNATWGEWTRVMLKAEAGADADLLAALADTLGFDMARGAFAPDSIVIAETGAVVADHMMRHLPQQDVASLIARMNAAAASVAQVEAVPLAAFFKALRADGFLLGLATNDAEAPAREHLTRADIMDMFDFIAGYDSGHGAKPAPGQLLAFCAKTGLPPADCAMVGDSLHDLHAGRAAGMVTIGVLTGPATADALAPAADIVLPSIADIPAWIAARAP